MNALRHRFQIARELLVCCTVFSAISVASAESVQSLGDELSVEEVLTTLLGASLNATRVSYSGENGQAGTFEGYEFLFGDEFGRGIVLSSGSVTSVVATSNNSDKSTTEYSSQSVDDEHLGDNVYDPAKLEISFYPTFETITLDFIFGSEEYNEYVQTEFNDQIKILVNGENCAKTPDGQSFSVNAVNNREIFPPLEGDPGASSNAELFINNDPGLDANNKGSEAGTTAATYATQMDGFTKLIQCSAVVNPGELNELVIGVIDVGDAEYDSWVFFRAGSLNSTPVGSGPLDSDNDGIFDVVESPNGVDIDTDGDGIADRFDLDSDNDGIPDSIEHLGDDSLDKNMDGYLDSTLRAPDANPVSPVDTDADGIPDYLDYESDSDSLTDLLESLPTGTTLEMLDANGDGILDDTTDADRDGLFDVVDPVVAGGDSGQPLLLLDLDNDGLYNYRDVDSDGDEFEDDLENGDFNNDGINDRLQQAEGLYTAVSGVGSLNAMVLLGLTVLLLVRRLRN